MNRLISFACVTLCVACSSPPSTPLDQFLESPPEPVQLLADVDPRVVDFLLEKFEDRQLADWGQPFQETDFIKEPGLPWRRFVVAAKSGNQWLVVYEHGGFGYHHHVVLLSVGDNPPAVLYSGKGFLQVDSELVRRQIENGAVEEDTEATYW